MTVAERLSPLRPVDLYVCHSLHLDFLVPILPNHPPLPYDGEYLSPYLWIILQNIHMISFCFPVDVLSDEVPVQVHLEAFNPCVPLDSKNSGIPVVVLNYTVTNSSKDAAKVNYFVMTKLSHYILICLGCSTEQGLTVHYTYWL